jgi:hypothetical protein
MIAEKASESINQAVVYELQKIVKNYGATYASEHEGYAVLLEEVEEAGDDLKYINLLMNELWKEVKSDSVSKDFLNSIKVGAIELAKEAVQVAAVCERFEETIANKSEPPTYREDKTIL